MMSSIVVALPAVCEAMILATDSIDRLQSLKFSLPTPPMLDPSEEVAVTNSIRKWKMDETATIGRVRLYYDEYCARKLIEHEAGNDRTSMDVVLVQARVFSLLHQVADSEGGNRQSIVHSEQEELGERMRMYRAETHVLRQKEHEKHLNEMAMRELEREKIEAAERRKRNGEELHQLEMQQRHNLELQLSSLSQEEARITHKAEQKRSETRARLDDEERRIRLEMEAREAEKEMNRRLMLRHMEEEEQRLLESFEAKQRRADKERADGLERLRKEEQNVQESVARREKERQEWKDMTLEGARAEEEWLRKKVHDADVERQRALERQLRQLQQREGAIHAERLAKARAEEDMRRAALQQLLQQERLLAQQVRERELLAEQKRQDNLQRVRTALEAEEAHLADRVVARANAQSMLQEVYLENLRHEQDHLESERRRRQDTDRLEQIAFLAGQQQHLQSRIHQQYADPMHRML